jgi:hypothetical protein
MSGFYKIAESVWADYFKSTWTASTLEEVMKIQRGE